MQRNVQARTQDGGGCLSYGNPTCRRHRASFRTAFREWIYLRLVTLNLEEPRFRSRLTGKGMDRQLRRSVGMTLVERLVKQVEGSIEVDASSGTVWKIIFPL